METIKPGDVTNYGRVEAITMYGHYKIQNGGVVGSFREVFKVRVKNEKEVEILTKSPIE